MESKYKEGQLSSIIVTVSCATVQKVVFEA